MVGGCYRLGGYMFILVGGSGEVVCVEEGGCWREEEVRSKLVGFFVV